jgi:hypothetical protein
VYAGSAGKIRGALSLRRYQRPEFHTTLPTASGRQNRLQRSGNHGKLPLAASEAQRHGNQASEVINK